MISQQDQGPILQALDVRKTFGELAAVDNLSFDVQRGEIFGVAGPNGSGKTTLMNVLTQVVPCTSGRIYFKGTRIDNKSTSSICRMGIARTFQKPTVFDTMTVYNNLYVASVFGYPGHHSGNVGKTIQDTLKFVGYDKSPDLVAGSLIVNDRKKVMMAVALCTHPELLILDEPCAGLNVLEYNEVIEIIKAISAQGVTVIFIEHNMKVLMNVSDRVLIMDHGTALCLGTPSEVCCNELVIEKYLGSNRIVGMKG